MKEQSRFFTFGRLFSFATWLLLAPAWAAAQQGIPIAGQVLDAQGEPFVGATVTLAVEVSEHEATKLVLAGHTRPEPLVTVASDEGGWFSMEAPEAGLWRVTVEARDHVSMRNKLLPLVDVAVLPALRLMPAGSHTVTVVDAVGKAVAGAQVWAAGDQRWQAYRRDGWSPTGRFVLTDDQGKATLARAEDETLWVYAFAPGFAVPKIRRTKAGTSEVALEKGVSFDILFQDPQGEPLEGATVRLGSGGAAAALLGEDGRIALALLPDQALPFDVSTPAGHQQGGTLRLDTDALKAIEAGKPQIMTLPEPIVVAGQVVEDGSRTPVAGALVWNPREPRFAVHTDRRGGYRMVLREASKITLRAAAVGYSVGSSELQIDGSDRPNAPTLVLHAAGSVVGRVVDGEGQPVSGAKVQVRPAAASRLNTVQRAIEGKRTVSLPDGRFYFATLAPKLDWQVVVRARGFAEARKVAQSGAEVEIMLVAPRKARGVVIDADGASIVGAEVLVIPLPADPNPMFMAQLENELWSEDEAPFPRGETGEQGRFEIVGLASGMVVLGVRAAGYAPVVRESIHIGDASTTDLGVIRLPPAVTMAGMVVDKDDRPIEGVRIHWHVGRYDASVAMRMNEILHDSERRLTTGVDGRFAIPHLEAGVPVDISAYAQGFVNQRAPGVAASTEESVRIVMTQGAAIAGTVVDRRGAPLARAAVRAGRSGQRSRLGTRRGEQYGSTNAEGIFELSGLAAGTLYVVAELPGHGSARIEGIELGPGDHREDLRLVLDAGVTLTGQITDSQGRMVEGATVSAFKRVETNPFAVGASDRSDGDGRYLLVFDESGAFRITIQHSDLLGVEKALVLEAGEQRHDFVLRSGHTIRGEVIGGDNVPVAGARVTIEGHHQSYMPPRSVHTDEAGRFLIEGLDDGSYHLVAGVADWAQTRLDTLSIAGADVSDLVIRLTRGTVVRGRIVGLAEGERQQVMVEVMRTGAFTRRPAQVEADGTAYRVDHLGVGSWQVMARLPNGRVVNERIEVVANEQETLRDLVFETGWTVTGLATVNGQPLAGAFISASAHNGSIGSTRTDRDGRYRLGGLPSGVVFFNLMSADSEIVEMRTRKLDADTEVSFAIETSPIIGRVVTAEGQVLAGATVALLPQGERSHFGFSGTVLTGPDGSFALTASQTGAHKLQVTLSGYRPAARAFEIVSGAEVGVLTIVLQRAETPESE